MRKALVRRDLQRLFQVADAVFPVAAPMEWLDCADDVKPETHAFDGAGFALKPTAPAVPSTAGIKEQRARALDALAASDPIVAKIVDVLKTAGMI